MPTLTPTPKRLTEKVRFRAAFPRHGKTQTSLALLIWLTEKVRFRAAFPRHGKAQTSLALLIWLTEKVLIVRLSVTKVVKIICCYTDIL